MIIYFQAPYNSSTPHPMRVGGMPGSINNALDPITSRWQGSIDEVAVWERALLQSEVEELCRGGSLSSLIDVYLKDTDSDGTVDAFEHVFGNDPQDNASTLEILDVEISSDQFIVTGSRLTEKLYLLQGSTDLHRWFVIPSIRMDNQMIARRVAGVKYLRIAVRN